MQGLFFFAYLAVGVFQIMAGMEGIQLYLGVGTFVSLILFLFSFAIPLAGTLVAAVAVYYGARYGWRWEWWQAVLLAAPGLVVMALVFFAGGLGAVFSRR